MSSCMSAYDSLWGSEEVGAEAREYADGELEAGPPFG